MPSRLSFAGLSIKKEMETQCCIEGTNNTLSEAHDSLICDGLSSKAPVSLAAYVKMSTSLEGRDKMTKIMQYGARFFYWYFKSLGITHLADSAFSLYKTTQLSRKAFRIAKVLDEVVKYRAAIAAGGYMSYPQSLLALRSIAMGAFWTFDNFTYFTLTKQLKFNTKRTVAAFGKAWAVAGVFGFLHALHMHKKARAQRQSLRIELDATRCAEAAAAGGEASEQKGEGQRSVADIRANLSDVNAEQFKHTLALIKAVLDFICAINIPGVDIPEKLLGRRLNDGVVGINGVISGLITCYNAWPDKPKALASAPKPAAA